MNRIRSALITVLVVFTASAGADQREDIHSSADQVQPLLAGMNAPAFTVKDANNELFHFLPGEMDKPVVLSFFRGGWCPYCNLHLAEMRHAEEQLKAMGFDIWFISMDKPELLLESLDDPDIGYTIFSDASLEATRAFGLAFRLDDALVKKYKTYNIDIEKVSGENHHVLPAPATYIIGTDGVINFAYINPNYKVRLHPDVLLAAAKVYRQDADKRLIKRRKELTK